MSYITEMQEFNNKYSRQILKVHGGTFSYILAGPQDASTTLVFLNGGMNCLEMWMRYVDDLSNDYRVLLFDYPMEYKTNQELVDGMDAFFQELNIRKPVLVGASDGGMVAQIYTQRHPENIGGLVLISTGGMDKRTLNRLKVQYFFAPVLLAFMRHSNYEKLKPKLVKVGMSNMPKNSSPKDMAYVKDMFESLFQYNMTKEKDVAVTTLLADLMNQTPVTARTFAPLEGKILLILPNEDFFSKKMQEDLVALMHNPKIEYVSGGHLETILRAESYIQKIRAFLDGFEA